MNDSVSNWMLPLVYVPAEVLEMGTQSSLKSDEYNLEGVLSLPTHTDTV